MQNNSGANEAFKDGELDEDTLDGVSGGVKGSGIDDMSSVDQMKMQMYQERRAKFAQTLTNVTKKLSNVTDTITSNLK